MSSEIDYTQHTEEELVEMFGRMDPRYAPAECEQLGQHLRKLGYCVTEGGTEPGVASPSPAMILAKIGSEDPIEFNIEFGDLKQPLSAWAMPSNGIGFVGTGTLVTDGFSLHLSGHVFSPGEYQPSLFQENAELFFGDIANVESRGRLVRFEFNCEDASPDSICLWMEDSLAAGRLVRILPKRRTKDFKPRLTE